MALPVYFGLEAFKTELGIDDTADDERFMRHLDAASRIVDRLCRRAPGDFSPQTATRTFDVSGEWSGRSMTTDGMVGYESQFLSSNLGPSARLFIPPLLEVTTLKTDEDADGTFEVTWTATTDYILYPLNTLPKREIQANLFTGSYRFPVGQQTVQIVGSWGEYSAVPYDIAEATLLLANRLRNRSKTPEGMMGDAERGFTNMNEIDPDVRSILVAGRYIDHRVFA